LVYKKDLNCLKCKHFYICDGIEKELFGKTELHPELGEKIKEVNYRGTFQSVWQLFPDKFYAELQKFPRWN
jgi:hypothetical protein